VATRQFEVGDPALDTERGVTMELGVRLGGGRLAGELRAFASRYHDFIYLAPTGIEADGLPVHAYRQEDSRFEGLEAEFELPLGIGPFTLALTGEYLRGRVEGAGDLPRMPPLGIGARLGYDEAAWSASLTLSHHFDQEHVAALELPTDAYTMLDADLVFRPAWLDESLVLFLRGRNLLDDTARMHTSPLKDELPLPGRSIGAGLRVTIGP
jgi:iron complex outermembrane receptor protein